MNDFFGTMYGWTRGFYGKQIDDFMLNEIDNVSGSGVGYLHCGFALIAFSLIVSLLFYYVFAPVRKKYFWWWLFASINAVVNFVFAIWYTLTPLVNNEIPQEAEWSDFDCVMFAFTNALWSLLYFGVASFIVKWKSIDKYVPFKFF